MCDPSGYALWIINTFLRVLSRRGIIITYPMCTLIVLMATALADTLLCMAATKVQTLVALESRVRGNALHHNCMHALV